MKSDDKGEKTAVIKQENGEYVLYTRDGRKILGKHPTRQAAIKQEYAITKSKEREAEDDTVKEAMTQIRTKAPVRIANRRYKGCRYGYTLELDGRYFKTEDGVRNTREHAGKMDYLVLNGKVFELQPSKTTKKAAFSLVINISRRILVPDSAHESEDTESTEGDDQDGVKDTGEREDVESDIAACPGGGMIKTVPLEIVDPDDDTVKGRVDAEFANTPEEKAKGLAGRESIKEGSGMLFSTAGPFWMKDTKIPLDILFLSKEGCVLDVQTMKPYPGAPDFLLPRHESAAPGATAALELPAGFCKRSGIKTGARVRLAAATC